MFVVKIPFKRKRVIFINTVYVFERVLILLGIQNKQMKCFTAWSVIYLLLLVLFLFMVCQNNF